MKRRDFLKIVAAAVVCPKLLTEPAKAKIVVPNYLSLPIYDVYVDMSVNFICKNARYNGVLVNSE